MAALARLLLFVCSLSLLAASEFIAPDAFAPLQIVPPPPAAGSIEQEADEVGVLLAELNRTPEQVALAKRWEKYDVFKLVQPVLGEWADEKTLPQLAAFIKKSAAETKPFTDSVKKADSRPRPFVVNPALHPVLDKPESPAYPSGHAVGAALHAALLAAILPEHAADFLHQAELARLSRVYAGVHFATDIVAGRRLGEAIAREMLKSPATQQAIREVRAEILAALSGHQKAA